MPKRSIRARLLAERKSYPLAACVEQSLMVQQRFLQSPQYRNAACLALYSSIHNEVQTEEVARSAIAAGKSLVYPRIKGEHLEFVLVPALTELAAGTYGVLEPQGRELVPVAALDVIVVPGVAFDRDGHRLGYGRGFYDRVLAGCREGCAKVGFAYDFQLVAALPAAQHDRKLSMLVTESSTLTFTP